MHSGTPAMRLPSTEQTAVCDSIQTKEVFPVSAEMQTLISLSEIAERFGTTVSSLSALNGIADPNLIYAGNTLRIPQGGNSASVYYTIQPGDTLSEIAERFGTTVASLSALNGISDPNLIYAGNTLLISQ